MAEVTHVDAIVTAVVHEFQLAYARDEAGFQYAINADTAGAPWGDLHEGQRVRLEVTPPPVRVLHVEQLGPNATTVTAIKAAKGGKTSDISLDDL